MQAAIVVDNPEQMNLLGLLIKGYLEQKLASPKLARRAEKLRGDFGVQAGQMAITLSFPGNGIVIRKGIAPKTRARVRGPMNEMLGLVTGGNLISAVIAVLEGRIAIGGNPFALLGLLPLMMGPAPTKALPPSPGASS